MLSETWWKKCVLIWEFLKTKTMMECVYLPLKGGCFLCLNKTLRSPPTAVSFINIMVVGMRIAAAQTPSQPWAQPWIDLLCWWDERWGFHPVTLQMNLLEASCGRKSIYRLLTHSSCCQKLSTAFEATCPVCCHGLPVLTGCSKTEVYRKGSEIFGFFSFLTSDCSHGEYYYLFNICAKGRKHKKLKVSVRLGQLSQN